jgi:16S rRNA (uracil1498-N3)-methyltransferase
MSTPPLFFVDPLPSAGALRLDGDEGRHAARVRRIGLGEAIVVADGLGAVADCVVTEVLADGLRLDVVDWRHVPPPDPYLVVAQALPKGERAELAVEVMTEVGVDEVLPWSAARSIVQWREGRGNKALERWRRTAREAAKQSRRPRVPVVTDLASTQDVAERMRNGCGLVLHEDATIALAGAPLPGSGEIVLVVGPEGGVGDEELDIFAAAGATAVRLGDTVLRTSTAGAAALSVLSARIGRWA